jgi:hypothetical protein
MDVPSTFADAALEPIATLSPAPPEDRRAQAPIPTELEEVLTLPALFPINILFDPATLEQKALKPTATLPDPPVLEQEALNPIATLPTPVLFFRALQPSAALLASVQPLTVPKQVGVAAPDPQQMLLTPVEIRNWPAVPQLLAQSMMPAPGLMFFPLSPVSQ